MQCTRSSLFRTVLLQECESGANGSSPCRSSDLPWPMDVGVVLVVTFDATSASAATSPSVPTPTFQLGRACFMYRDIHDILDLLVKIAARSAPVPMRNLSFLWMLWVLTSMEQSVGFNARLSSLETHELRPAQTSRMIGCTLPTRGQAPF